MNQQTQNTDNNRINQGIKIKSMESVAAGIEALPPVSASVVKGYRIYRSPVQVKYVNVVAVDESENILVVVASDLTIDEAQELVSILNQAYDIPKGPQF